MSEIDNISITYSDTVDNINIDYLSTVDNITLSLGTAIASGGGAVDSVNSLTGEVVLTASTVLTNDDIINGEYVHVFQHNLNDDHPIVFVYDITDTQVFANIVSIDANNVRINAAIDLTGYKAVAQR